MEYLSIIGRNKQLFTKDIDQHEVKLSSTVKNSNFLVIGAAGSIGKAVTKEIFKRDPKLLHVVDISENNMVELVRDLRSSYGYTSGEFQSLSIDCGSFEFDAFMNTGNQYDYVLNLSAMKHVRSERDPFTLMRLIDVNIFNTLKTYRLSMLAGAKKYFCVSTDKAANPVNMMGASKRIMEILLARESTELDVSMSRFANVAFSDGSLLHGFNQRLLQRQPITAPHDVKRYFVTPQESGELCLMSAIFGENHEIFFPKLSEELDLERFSDIAARYLLSHGYEPVLCRSEIEARERAKDLIYQKKWPCYFFDSDTTGEKNFEEFYTASESIDFDRFDGIGVINGAIDTHTGNLDYFIKAIDTLKISGVWSKKDLVDAFRLVLPDFQHLELEKSLDGRM